MNEQEHESKDPEHCEREWFVKTLPIKKTETGYVHEYRLSMSDDRNSSSKLMKGYAVTFRIEAKSPDRNSDEVKSALAEAFREAEKKIIEHVSSLQNKSAEASDAGQD